LSQVKFLVHRLAVIPEIKVYVIEVDENYLNKLRKQNRFSAKIIF
jgi:hypothetical protein